MADSLFGSSSDPLAALSPDTSSQRAQLAQYSILRAATYLQDNRNDEALREFKKALAFDPQNTTAQTYIGKLNLAKGNTFEAIKAFKLVVQSQPNSVDAHVNLANAYIQDNQYANSEKELKAAARLDPTNPLPDYTLGLQYSNTDRLAEAEAQFLKVKKISPSDGNVYYALGMVYNKMGRYQDAADNLEKSLTLKKNFPSANYELGVAYDGLGRTEDAQDQLKILENTDPVQAQNLSSILEKPGMVYMDTKTSGGFMELLGPGTPLWMLDPTMLTQPNSGKAFSVTIAFKTDMDMASVTNTQNWTISRANSAGGGYYNNTMPVSPREVQLPANPETVFYNSYTRETTLMFRLNQNSAGDAEIDPSHIVFKFSGKDASGKDMDQTADEIDGFSTVPF
jgi:tetratricopeptide (TPR) repeat protein